MLADTVLVPAFLVELDAAMDELRAQSPAMHARQVLYVFCQFCADPASALPDETRVAATHVHAELPRGFGRWSEKRRVDLAASLAPCVAAFKAHQPALTRAHYALDSPALSARLFHALAMSLVRDTCFHQALWASGVHSHGTVTARLEARGVLEPDEFRVAFRAQLATTASPDTFLSDRADAILAFIDYARGPMPMLVEE